MNRPWSRRPKNPRPLCALRPPAPPGPFSLTLKDGRVCTFFVLDTHDLGSMPERQLLLEWAKSAGYRFPSGKDLEARQFVVAHPEQVHGRWLVSVCEVPGVAMIWGGSEPCMIDYDSLPRYHATHVLLVKVDA